jgi:hypothetical protein
LEQCRVILDFDKAKVKKDNQFFNEVIFDKIRSQCDKDFSFANVELNEENCSFIIREPKSYFKRNYIFLDKEVCDENADFDSEAD